MILRATIDSYDLKALSDEGYATLRAAIPQLPEKKDTYFYTDVLIDDNGINALSKTKVNIRLADGPGSSDVNTMLVKLQNRINDLELRDNDSIVNLAAKGAVVQIAIPDLALMYINEVLVECNCCTDHLQELLDDGWRILAVCPPNAQRRPDYVLGRRKDRK